MDEIKIETFPHLEVGNVFTFKDRKCTVTKMSKNGFHYSVQNSDIPGFMTYLYYMSTPSAKGRKL